MILIQMENRIPRQMDAHHTLLHQVIVDRMTLQISSLTKSAVHAAVEIHVMTLMMEITIQLAKTVQITVLIILSYVIQLQILLISLQVLCAVHAKVVKR